MIQSVRTGNWRITSSVCKLIGVSVCLWGVGCRPVENQPSARPVGDKSIEEQSSVFRQAIDQAKSLEKRINDRAIDPGENGRIDETDPTGQKH